MKIIYPFQFLLIFFSFCIVAAQDADVCTDPLEPNNTSIQASNLGTSTSYSNANLCLTPGDEDWLRFTYNGQIYYILVKGYAGTTEGAYGLNFSLSGSTVTIYTYETDGATDTKMYLYNSSFTELAYDDDGGTGYFSSIVHGLACCGGCADPLEPNNSSSQAFNLGTTTSYSNANLCLTPGDEDWLKFTYNGQVHYILVKGYSSTTEGAYGLRFSRSDANVTIETFETDGANDTKMYLYNSSLQQIAFDDDGGTGYFSRIVNNIGFTCMDVLEPNNTSSQAFDLGTTTSYDNARLCIAAEGDEDWLKFTYNSQTYYIRVMGFSNTTMGTYGLIFSRSGSIVTIETYETNGATDTKMYLYDSDFNELAFDDDGGTGYFSRIVHTIIDDICVDPLEPNNTSSQAAVLEYLGDKSNLCLTAGDEDWFKYQAKTGEIYYIRVIGYSGSTEGAYGLRMIGLQPAGTRILETYETNGSTDTKMYLYNESLQQIAFDDDGGSGYFSRIDFKIGGCRDPLEPNNTTSQATNLGTTETYGNSGLCLTQGDEDWFMFTHNSQVYYILIKGYAGTTEGAYGFRFNRSPAGQLNFHTYETDGATDTKMYLFAADNLTESIAYDDDGGSGYFSRIVHTIVDDDCVDPLEPNDRVNHGYYLSASTYYNNADLCLTPGDEDWFESSTKDYGTYYFRIVGYNSATEGAYGLRFTRSDATMTIETYETDGSTDTKIYLLRRNLIDDKIYDIIAFDDDGGSGYFSRLVYTIGGGSAPSNQTEETASGSKAENDISLDSPNAYGVDEFSIFPNPTEGKFTVRMASGQEDNLILEIMDATGKLLIQKQVHSSGGEFREDIDLSDQPAGMYFINLKGNDFHKVGKVVVH